MGAALISQVGGYLSINYALGHLPASVVSTTLLTQPVLTAILAVPLLGEGIGWGQVAGGAIVLAGIWLVHRQRSLAAGRAAAAGGTTEMATLDRANG